MSNLSFFSYFHSMEYLVVSLDIITIISLPFEFFGLFAIYSVAQRRIGGARPFLFNLQVWTIMFDISLNILLAPYVFFPVVGACFLGILEKLNCDFKLQIYIMQLVTVFLGIATIMIFENRHSKVTTIRYRIKKSIVRILFFGMNFLIGIVSQLYYYHEDTDTVEHKKKVIKKYPEIGNDILFSSNSHILTTDSNMVSLLSLFQLLLIVGQGFGFAVHSAIHLVYIPNISLSRATMKMQRTFLFSLSFQIAIPFFIVSVPITILSIVTTIGTYNQALNNNAVIVSSSHGFLSTVGLLLLHRPYREFTIEQFSRKSKKSKAITPIDTSFML